MGYPHRDHPGLDCGERRKSVSKPSLRDRLRPLELLLLSGIVAVAIGLTVLLSTREPNVALVFAGIAFIVSLMVFAMLALAAKPTGDEQLDLDEQDRGAGH